MTLELKEYYSRLELISDNLNTITDKNELLESNGVLFLDFKVGDKKIKLKKDKKLKLQFAQEFRKEDRIFNGVLDSLGQIKWFKNNESYTVFSIPDYELTSRYRGVETYREKIIPIDSIQYYQDINIESKWWLNPPILIDNFGWINVDKFLNPDSKISYELSLNIKKLDYINSFFLYKGLNSFISDYRKSDSLIFTDIPLKNETSLIIIGKKGNDYFAEKSILNSDISGKLKMNLIKIDSTELKNLIKK